MKVMKADWGTFSRRLPKAGAAIMMPVLVLVPSIFRFLTPTEVAALPLFMLVKRLFIYRTVNKTVCGMLL